MKDKSTFYVTTPIYYVTAKPHLGSLYSTLVADIVARWAQLNGKQARMQTGTDEHGQKIVEAAHTAGKEPKEFIDQFIPAYHEAWQAYNIGYHNFVRTTDSQHIAGVHEFIKKLLETGDIYKSTYTGWYCTPCETFVTEKEDEAAKGTQQGPVCPSCGRQTERVSEQTYFFKLSKYQDKLLKLFKNNPDFIVPRERANEVISFVEAGLKDLSISRTTVKWGVPFPDDPEHVIYVWVEALCNYITGVGYGQTGKEREFEKWWPADMQVLGKDIVRFHAIFWPAFLMAAGLPLPKRLLVHGWIKVDEQKMSKSFGNVVDPMVLKKLFNPEAVRYYLMRQIPINQDGNFSIKDLEARVASDLANDLGNLLNRMVSLAEKNDLMLVEPPSTWHEKEMHLRDEAWDAIEDYELHMNNCEFHLALARLWKFINQVNAFFHAQEPWKLAKSDKEAFAQVISATAHSLRIIAVLAWPVMPQKMSMLMESLGVPFEPENHLLEDLELGRWHQAFRFKKIDPLFVKPEIAKEIMEEKEPVKTEEKNYIGIEDFAKVELIVGTIKVCEPIEKSDKLYRLEVDCGEDQARQILSGIRKAFAPEDLVGKQGIVVANLKPRKMMGLESQGMLLTVDNGEGGLALASVASPVPNGTRLK